MIEKLEKCHNINCGMSYFQRIEIINILNKKNIMITDPKNENEIFWSKPSKRKSF